MKRKILLFAATLGVLMGLFVAYQSVSRFTGGGRFEANSPAVDAKLEGPTTNRGDGMVERADKVIVKRLGKDDRIESRYIADRVRKEDDGSYTLINPEFEIYLRDGQNVFINSERGNVVGEQVAGGVEPHRGRLTGDVSITIDRAPSGIPLEDRPLTLIRIHVDDITFNNQLLTLETEGKVVVWSREADIYGTGLFIGWNQQPRELRELRIEKGEYMSVKEMRERVDMVFLPGGEGRTQPTSDPGPVAKAVEPDLNEAHAVAEPAPEEATADRPARNVYQADLFDDVRVSSGDRSLRGVRRLTILFEWAGKLEDLQRRSAGGPADGSAASAPAEGAGPGGVATPEGPSMGPDEAEARAARAAEEDAPAEPMHIYWSGPLVITPEGHTEEPSGKRYTVVARGERLELSDGQARAVCGEFVYSNPDKIGRMTADEGEKVVLTLKDGQVVEAPDMRFDLKEQLAYFVGEGRMLSPAGEGVRLMTSPPQTRGGAAAPTPDAAEEFDEITWSEQVTAAFEETEVRGENGRPRRVQTLRSATFEGDVALLAAGGDFVTCEEALEISMTLGDEGNAYPRQVAAFGAVSADWEGSALESESLELYFREVEQEDPQTGETVKRIRASRLRALRDVWMASLFEDGDLLEARADELESDLLQRWATLSGDPAVVEHRHDTLEGENIVIREAGQELRVKGSGKLTFMTTSDLDGADLEEPRPLDVTWSRRMDFSGEQNAASFSGDVRLDIRSTRETADDPQTQEHEQLTCGVMRVLFRSDETESDSPTEAGNPGESSGADAGSAAEMPLDEPHDAGTGHAASSNSLAVSMSSYSGRKISIISAEEEVVVLSRMETGEGKLLQRMRLEAPELVYDTGLRRIDVLGAGRLLFEDYRPSRVRRARRKDDGGGLSGGIVAPSQTAFTWQTSMTLKQIDREAILDGRVRMVHASGSKVVFAEDLNAPAWGKLPGGKRIELKRADVVIAGFTSDPDADQRDDRTDPDLGVLQTLSARGDVLLEEADTTVTCERALYSRDLEMVTVQGEMSGRNRTPAILTRRDPKTRRYQTFRGEEIIWYLRNNHIQARGVSAGGTR